MPLSWFLFEIMRQVRVGVILILHGYFSRYVVAAARQGPTTEAGDDAGSADCQDAAGIMRPKKLYWDVESVCMALCCYCLELKLKY